MTKGETAFETTFIWFIGIVAVGLVLAVVGACIIGPLQGQWAPDIGVGFWAVVAGLFYLVYRIVKWRQV